MEPDSHAQLKKLCPIPSDPFSFTAGAVSTREPVPGWASSGQQSMEAKHCSVGEVVRHRFCASLRTGTATAWAPGLKTLNGLPSEHPKGELH